MATFPERHRVSHTSDSRHHFGRAFLGIVLACVLVVGLCPTVSFADESMDEAVADDASYDVIDEAADDAASDDAENEAVALSDGSEPALGTALAPSNELTPEASHLYYRGDANAPAYNMAFDEGMGLTIAYGDGAEVTYDVAEIESLVLSEDIGYEGVYTDYVSGVLTNTTYTGLKLYQLLTEVLPYDYADEAPVTLYAFDGSRTEVTMGDLRQSERSFSDEDGADGVGVEVPWLLAYGRDGTPLLTYQDLLAEASGPLMVVSGQTSSTTPAITTNIVRIEIGQAALAATQPVTFTASCAGVTLSGLDITVTDAFGNVWAAREGVYYLNEDETFSYEVGCAGYTTATGTIDIEQSPITVNVDLLTVYNGTPSAAEMDDDGYYEIYTAEELVWWVNNASASSNVRLMADVALNDGVTYDKDKSFSWPVDKLGKYDNAYSGTFDGNGHTIYGFYIYRENTIDLWDSLGTPQMISDNIPYIGFLGYGRYATVTNLGIDGRIDVLDRPDSSYATFMNIGGIFGYGYHVTVEGCAVNVGINYLPATGSGTLDGYPYDGWPEACDTYIGGIIGNASGATITDCYTRGEAIASGATRSSSAGGIIGRASNSVMKNCYSTMKLSAMPYEGSSFVSYQGGIMAKADDSLGSSSIGYCVALNRSIDGGNDTYSVAHRVSGDSASITRCLGLEGLPITNAATGESSLNGEDLSLSASTVASSYTGIGWEDVTNDADATSGWRFPTDAYPRLWWEDLSVSQTPDQTSDEVDIGDVHEGDDGSGFSSSNPPSKFTLNVKVGSHDTITAKVFTSSELRSMSTNEKVKYSCYTYSAYGRVVMQYIPFEDLIESVGIEFDAGDALIFGGYSYSYESYFGTERYYYPHWDSYVSGDEVVVPTAFVLKSYGSSMSGGGDTMLDYYASSADYLYAYMICFGMSSINDWSGSLFINQQTAATVSLDATSPVDELIKDMLIDAVQRAEDDRDSTSVGDSPDEVGSGITFVPEEVMEALKEAIEAASAVLADENATNDEVLTAVEDLEASIDAFDAAKQTGKKPVDYNALQDAIASGSEHVALVDDGVIVKADSDGDLTPGTLRVPYANYESLASIISQASRLVGDAYLTQAQINEITENVLACIQDFEDSIVTVRAKHTMSVTPATGGTIEIFVGDEMIATDGDTCDVAEEDQVVIAPRADAGYEVTDVSVCDTAGEDIGAEVGLVAGADDKWMFTMPTSDVVVSAAFTAIEYSITVDADAARGSVAVSVDGVVTGAESGAAGDVVHATVGQEIVLTPTPVDGYELETLIVDGVPVSLTNGAYTFLMPADDVVVSAAFTAIEYAITIDSDASQGSVSVSVDGVAADAEAGAAGDVVRATVGQEIVLTLAPVSGYELAALVVNDEQVEPSRGVYTFTMHASPVLVQVTWQEVPPEPATPISDSMFAVDTADETYTGQPIEKAIASVLTPGVDYTVEYENNVDAGTATLIITGIGDYEGTLTYEFAIERAFVRLAGDDRYGTMEEVDDEGFDAADVVVLTAGSNFPDALAAAGLAGTLDAPVVLTASNVLSSAAADEIARLGTSRVVIVGGEASVSSDVAVELKDMGLLVERVSGDDRYATALEVYYAGADAWGTSGNGTAKTAIIAAGGSFADTLSASSYAWWATAPIFLTSSAGLDNATMTAIESGGFERIVIVGGIASVPVSVEEWASDVAPTVRLAGENRYATSVEFASWAAGEGMSFNDAGVATGKNFPDALAGGALCGQRGSVVLLADVDATDGTAAVDLLAGHKNEISRLYYLGGTASVTSELADLIESALG